MLTYIHGFLPSFELLHIQESNLVPTEHQMWPLPNSLHGSLHGFLPNTLLGEYLEW